MKTLTVLCLLVGMVCLKHQTVNAWSYRPLPGNFPSRGPPPGNLPDRRPQLGNIPTHKPPLGSPPDRRPPLGNIPIYRPPLGIVPSQKVIVPSSRPQPTPAGPSNPGVTINNWGRILHVSNKSYFLKLTVYRFVN